MASRSRFILFAFLMGPLALQLCGCERSVIQSLQENQRELFNLQTLGTIPYPADNPRRQERIALGRLLFYDPILSGERDVACGTCHHPQFAFADGRQLAAGVSGTGLGPNRLLSHSAVSGEPIPQVPRNTPTVLSAGMAGGGSGQATSESWLFWDGRAIGLEQQVSGPITARIEMRGDAIPGTEAEAAAAAMDTVLVRLRAIQEYVQLFSQAFPLEWQQYRQGLRPQVLDSSTLVRALAAYERELVTRNSAYDRYVEGDDHALTVQQKEGMFLFHSKARCVDCHSGPMFSLYGFVVSGVPPTGPGKSAIPGDDAGREEHTGESAHRYSFRTPSLRNVELTPPYMHNGVFGTLTDVVEFYNAGAKPRHPAISDQMLPAVLREPLGLTRREVDALVAFLRALTDPGTALDPWLVTVPDSVPSGLTPVYGLAGSQ